MKRYGFRKVEREVEDMCDYGNMIEKESVSKGKQIERIKKNLEHVKKLMTKLKMSFKEATAFLDIPEDEVLELEEVFNSEHEKKS